MIGAPASDPHRRFIHRTDSPLDRRAKRVAAGRPAGSEPETPGIPPGACCEYRRRGNESCAPAKMLLTLPDIPNTLFAELTIRRGYVFPRARRPEEDSMAAACNDDLDSEFATHTRLIPPMPAPSGTTHHSTSVSP